MPKIHKIELHNRHGGIYYLFEKREGRWLVIDWTQSSIEAETWLLKFAIDKLPTEYTPCTCCNGNVSFTT